MHCLQKLAQPQNCVAINPRLGISNNSISFLDSCSKYKGAEDQSDPVVRERRRNQLSDKSWHGKSWPVGWQVLAQRGFVNYVLIT